jgi:hypothetical protein
MSDRAASSGMEAPLRPATPDEVAEALSFALRYSGRRRVHHAESMRLRTTAARLATHLEEAGFVMMKRPETELIAATGAETREQVQPREVGS